jgi:molybdopterin/thiamine biosynthesis adenylyltransferase
MNRPSISGLTPEEFEYYSRQIVLKDFGLEGQRRLKNSRVCVVGAGGLGSPILTQLASMGVGTIRVIDRDVVEISNLQRQHLYGVDVIGVPKVEAAQNRLKQLNPYINVEPIPLSVTYNNAENLVQDMDVVIDALDSMRARYAVNRACVKFAKPLVHGAVIMEIGSATTIIPEKTACIECFQGGIKDEDLPSCAVMGVHPAVINLIASIQVSEAVKLILGEEPVLANYLLFADLHDLSLEKIKIAKAESCPVCGSKPLEKPPKVDEPFFEEICGRAGKRVFIFSPNENMNLNLSQVNSLIKDQGFITTMETRMGTSFRKGEIKGSVLNSGVTIVEGVKSKKDAMKIRNSILP